MARLLWLLRLFGSGRVRGCTGVRLCLSTCGRCETGLLSVARLLWLAVLARLPGLLRLFGSGRGGLGARRMILLWSGGRVPLGVLRGGRVRRVLTHAFPWLRCFGALVVLSGCTDDREGPGGRRLRAGRVRAAAEGILLFVRVGTRHEVDEFFDPPQKSGFQISIGTDRTENSTPRLTGRR